MKGLYKLLFALVAVVCCFSLYSPTSANAAFTDEGVYYPDLWHEVNWGDFEVQKESLKAEYTDVIVLADSWQFVFFLSNGQKHLYEQSSKTWLKPPAYYISVPMNSLTVSNCIYRNTSASVYYDGIEMIGSNYDYRGSSNLCYTLPHSNLLFEILDVNFTNLEISVGGTKYTLSESLPYYFAFDDGYGNIKVIFSDSPFSGTWLDLYTKQIVLDSSANVVTYYWNSLEQNDFVSSRSVSVGIEPITMKSISDYMCNYTLYFSNNGTTVFLKEKGSFDSSTDYDLETLCSNIPVELTKYSCYIIFRQNADVAMDDRIIFYGWNGLSYNLLINKANSQICAVKGNSAVSDFITAYYDELAGSWVVSDDVILGATNDLSYHAPKIYYTNSTLFLANSDWSNTGQVVEMASLDPPPFSENAEGSEENSEDGLISKFLSALANVFKYLFVPSSSFWSRELEQLASNFDFWKSVRDTVNVFIDFLNETDFSVPPKIEIDLGAINSIVDYGGTVYLLDLSWYEPYKESVDFILSSIMWLCFVWNTFKNLPNIINGVGSGLMASTSILKEEGEL